MSRRRDGGDDAREARQRDRRRDPYARERWRQEQRRADLDNADEVRNPTDDDYTVEDRSGLRIVPAPETVGGLLGGYVDQRGWGERLRGARLVDRWADVVGPELARRCEPVRVAGGVLVVRAESQAWATQLKYMTRQLVQQVDEHLGQGRVRELRIVVGPLGRGEPDER